MFPELDIDLLRTFVAVVESGSFTKASSAVFQRASILKRRVSRLTNGEGASTASRKPKYPKRIHGGVLYCCREGQGKSVKVVR
jgi:hypothetical protein